MNKQIAIPAAILGLLVIIAIGAVAATHKSSGSATSSQTSQATTPPPATSSANQAATPDPSPPASGGFRDGTYSATGSYTSPGGQEQIDVQLTVASGNITAVTVTPESDDR